MLQTIQRIGPVLDLFTPDRPEWGVAEVAESIGGARSSTHALLTSLVDIGLLQCRTRGRYRLGWRIAELSETLRGPLDLPACAVPVMQELVKQQGETLHLGVWERGKVLYLDKVVSTQAITVNGARVGSRLEPHCSALGKALLAHREEADAEHALVPEKLRRYTQATVVDPEALQGDLKKVRLRGLAFDLGEVVPELHCAAAPIRDEQGVVVGALSATAPSFRFRVKREALERAISNGSRLIATRLQEQHNQHELTPAD